MQRLPRITGSDALRAIRQAGWREARRRGSHVILHHRTRPGRVVIPVHAREVLKPKTLLSILHQAGMKLDDIQRVL